MQTFITELIPRQRPECMQFTGAEISFVICFFMSGCPGSCLCRGQSCYSRLYQSLADAHWDFQFLVSRRWNWAGMLRHWQKQTVSYETVCTS